MMHLLGSFWTKVITFCGLFNFSPLQDGSQRPFVIPSHIHSALNVVEHYPIFRPPGVPEDSKFECKYPAMPDWETCSTPEDRKCWLREKFTGKRFDIFTNYEDEMPIGVERRYNLTLEDSWFAADGLNFTTAKLFKKQGEDDNQYPGPWIQACWGDTVIVNVTNKLRTSKNGTSVHWHGIRQNQTMHMDGVNGVTQCPIAPEDYFVYKFKATQYGSSWYHSHYSVQYADGAVGPMTLHGPTSTEWDEAISPPLIITDWGHNTAFVAVTSNLENPDILLNGRGNVTRFNNNTQNKTKIEPPYNITFEGPQRGRSPKKYLLRIINTSFDTTFVFSIDNHRFQVISADFVPIQPYYAHSVLIGIGQRYNVIVEATPLNNEETGPLPSDGNYWIRTQVSPCFGKKTGTEGYEKTGILRYNSSSKAYPTTKNWNNIPTACREEDYASLVPILPWIVERPPKNGPPGGNGEKFDVLRNGSANVSEFFPLAKWSLAENQPFNPIRVDYTDPTFFHLDQQGGWNSLLNVVEENFTDRAWIYLAFKGKNNGQGAHPIHLHGHDFALLEQAYNKTFNPNTLNLNYYNPPRRDVALLPSDGYIVIAFKADNPGAWLVHCHIAFHISEGLGMQILEDQPQANKIWPKGNSSALDEAGRVCWNWERWYYNESNWAVPPWNPLCETKDRPDWCFQDDSGV